MNVLIFKSDHKRVGAIYFQLLLGLRSCITRTANSTRFFILVSVFFLATSAQGSEKEKEKCYPSQVDQSWNVNDNKRGTACYKQVQKVRALEFDPRFDCSTEIRQRWQREFDIADKMKCKL
ncbi:hypothetical protein D3C85_789170 [compost metagenome]